MSRRLPVSLSSVLLTLSLSACGAAPPQGQSPSTGTDPAATVAGACDSKTLSWLIGQVADETLIERARIEAGAMTVRMLRPGIMITREFSATRLNIRVDNERKVLTTSCG